jgi:hypothetical protein
MSMGDDDFDAVAKAIIERSGPLLIDMHFAP